MKVHFSNINSSRTRTIFERVLKAYKPLHDHNIILNQQALNKTTMRAQPVVNRSFWSKSKRKYRVDISPDCKVSPSLSSKDLPEDVLEGWFAHELGHIMDYKDRGAIGLIGFGIMYSLFTFYRVGAERMADIYAIEFGFASRILATKKFILNHSDLSNKYKQQIENYYMSPGEVELFLEKKGASPLLADDAGLLSN